jgi:hypothetical protein
MKLVTPALEVAAGEAFVNDVLGRQPFGEALLNIVSRTSEELVVSIDARWGEGKTTFVKMWQGLLSQSGIHSVYIDAFEHDYADDAFITVASAITTYAEGNISDEHRSEAIELKDKAKKVGGQLLSWTARVGIRAATIGIIRDSDIDALIDVKDDIAKGTSSFIGELIGERLSSHHRNVALITSFKEQLSKIPPRLEGNGSGPLVVIIDELDRCRPPFSVELLEKVKHLFSVSNVVFVLVMNRAQMEQSIRHVYGEIDSQAYLQKFVGLATTLPKRTSPRSGSDAKAYIERLLALHDLQTWGDNGAITRNLEALARKVDLSLRELEKVFTSLAVFYGSVNENHLRLVQLVIVVAVIKIRYPAIFLRLLESSATVDIVVEALHLCPMRSNDYDVQSRSIADMHSWVNFSLLSETDYLADRDNPDLHSCERALFTYQITREMIMPFIAERMAMFSVNR